MAHLLAALVSYVLGSIPSGVIAGRIAGVDIQKTGSGNIGATNVTRILGKKWGYPVFFADFAKGFAAVMLATVCCHKFSVPPNECVLVQITGAIFAVIGNALPVWLKFRGGKGVATSAGVLFALTPLAMLTGLAIWIIVFKISRYVSVASMVAALALPIAVGVIAHVRHTENSALLYFTICLAALVILRHRSNLVRLMQGTETRFEKKSED